MYSTFALRSSSSWCAQGNIFFTLSFFSFESCVLSRFVFLPALAGEFVALVPRLPGGLWHGEASPSNSFIGLGGAAEFGDSPAPSETPDISVIRACLSNDAQLWGAVPKI